MKAYALLAALAFAVPTESMAGHHSCGHGGVVVVGGGHGCYRPYYGYGYGRSYYGRSYYGYGGGYYGYGGGYYGGYYGGFPSVSFTYASAPRVYSASSGSYRNESGSLEADVQSALRRRGYYDGSIDGDIGPASRSAIRAYQSEHGLAVTGRIDAALLRSLGV